MRYLLLLSCLGLASCGTIRNLSQVGLREPASVHETEEFSETRLQASSLKEMAKSCPDDIKATYPQVAAELVRFPDCPNDLRTSFQDALPYLQMQERTTLEEVMNSQCRSMAKGQFSDSVEGLYFNFDSTGPLGRQKEIGKALEPAVQNILQALKKGVRELVQVHMPLDHWVEKNGSFVVPEDDLRFLQRLLVERKCKMASDEMEQSYLSMRALEELEKISSDEDQKNKIDRFLNGVHQVIEQKIREFFYP